MPPAQALPLLNDEVVAKMAPSVHVLLRHLDATLACDVEALSDGNRDRMFTAASALLQKSATLLTLAEGAASADRTVRAPASGRLWANPALTLVASTQPLQAAGPCPARAEGKNGALCLRWPRAPPPPTARRALPAGRPLKTKQREDDESLIMTPTLFDGSLEEPCPCQSSCINP